MADGVLDSGHCIASFALESHALPLLPKVAYDDEHDKRQAEADRKQGDVPARDAVLSTGREESKQRRRDDEHADHVADRP